jgi:hypothetical protein
LRGERQEASANGHHLPMVEYEAIRSLLQFLETPKLAKNHWSDNMGWQLAEHMER